MNEKNGAETTGHGGCERGGELVAYLYGEVTKGEAARFRLHLDECAVCREELAALGGVRAGLSAWRAEALGAIPSLNIEEALAPALQSANTRRRSARAALREFFSLSPPWLRAGAFAATLALSALLAQTLARAEVRWGSDGLAFRAGVTERVVKESVEVPIQSGYTEEQVTAIVARKVEEAKAQLAAEMNERTNEQRPGRIVNVKSDGKSTQPVPSPNAARRKRVPRRSTDFDDAQIADDLPRLSDLLNGSY